MLLLSLLILLLLVKMVMPLLPSRVTNMIGEWMWNPLQWEDVLPSQRLQQLGGFNDRSKNQHQMQQHTEGTDSGKKGASSPFSTTPPDDASALGTWKFPRLPSSTPKMQLLDIPTPEATDSLSDESDKNSVLKKMVDPAKGAAPSIDQKNTTILSEEVEPKQLGTSLQDLHSKSAVGPLFGQKKTGGDNSAGNDTPPTPRAAAEDASKISSRSNENGAGTKTESSMAGTSPTKPLELPLASSTPTPKTDPQTSSSVTLFGFVEKDKSSLSPSSDMESIHRDSKKEAGNLGDKADRAGVTLFPSMMDKDNYDFHDRRLDY